MMIIAMQPSGNHPHHHPHHHNSSSWRSTSSSFLPDDNDNLEDDDQGPGDVEQEEPSSTSFGYIPHASLPSAAAATATEQPLSISASFLPPESSKRVSGTTTAAAASLTSAASVPHQHHSRGTSGSGVSWLDQVAAVAAAASTSSSSGYLDDNSNVDAARRRQLQLQQQLHHQHQHQQRQREQLLDMYEQQQRRLDAEKLQLLHERQQAYLQQQQQQASAASARSSSYDDTTAAAAIATARGVPPMTLRDALLPSFLHPQQHQQQHQQRHPQQLHLQPTLSSDEYLLTRQGLNVYPPTQQPSMMLPVLPASYDGAGIHYQRSYESTGQWNPPLPAAAYAVAATSRSASWGNDGDIVAGMGGQHRGLSTIDDEHNYHHYDRYGPPTRGWMGTVGAASNNSPASDDGGDSGKIELDHDAPSIIRPVPDQIDFRAHKPGPDLESALVASLTGSHSSSVGAAVAAAAGGDKSSTTAASVAFPSERANLDALTTRCETPAQATRVLRIVGSTLRSKADPFIDVTTLPYVAASAPPPPTVNPSARSSHPAATSSASSSTSSRGKKSPTTSSTSSSNTSFPEILHELLEMSDREQLDDIVSWLPHKRAFRINNKDRFMTEILPLYFKGQNRWSSFLRQLNLYGFSRVAKGTDYGAYYHELMIGGRPDLCQFMRRVGTPKGLDRRTYKLAEGDDPDFYAMPLVLGSLPYPPPPTMDPHHHHHHHHHGRPSLPRHHPHDDDAHHHHHQHRHSSYRGL